MFTKKLVIWLTPEQNAFLEDEASRRRKLRETSVIETARGENSHVNKGMLIREALELTFDIAKGGNVTDQPIPGQERMEI